MKKIAWLFVILLSLLSCKQNKKDTAAYISVSIEPQRYFAEKIVGDKFKVKTIVSNGGSPEYFDPTPAQIVDFGKSKAYFMVGLFPFEKDLSTTLKENDKSILLINCSKGMTVKTLEEDHDNDSPHSGQDPHVWCSPQKAAEMSKNIYEGMVKLDPSNKAFYEKNYNALLDDIRTTDSLIKQSLSKVEVREFIIFHPALTYFAEEYGLKQYAIEHEGKSPSPVFMSELVNTAKKRGIKIIFIQPEYDKKNAENIAKEIDGRVVAINPLAYDWKDEMLKIANNLKTQ